MINSSWHRPDTHGYQRTHGRAIFRAQSQFNLQQFGEGVTQSTYRCPSSIWWAGSAAAGSGLDWYMATIKSKSQFFSVWAKCDSFSCFFFSNMNINTWCYCTFNGSYIEKWPPSEFFFGTIFFLKTLFPKDYVGQFWFWYPQMKDFPVICTLSALLLLSAAVYFQPDHQTGSVEETCVTSEQHT